MMQTNDEGYQRSKVAPRYADILTARIECGSESVTSEAHRAPTQAHERV